MKDETLRMKLIIVLGQTEKFHTFHKTRAKQGPKQ